MKVLLTTLALIGTGLLLFLWALSFPIHAKAATILFPSGGGTGSSTLTGILRGDGQAYVKTLLIGTGLSFDGTTLSATASSGSGSVSTSSQETATYVPFWTSTNGTPALLSGGDAGFFWNNIVKRLTFTYGSSTALTAGQLWSTNATSSSLYLTGLGSAGGLGADSTGRVYASATTTAGTGLTFSGNAFNVNTTQNITNLSNLSTNGYVKTSGSNGTLGVQAVPIPVTDGGTGSTTLVRSQVFYGGGDGVSYQSIATSAPSVTAPITYSGTLGYFINGVAGSFGCTNASSGVTGCLTGTDWNTFNNKLGSYDAFTHPVSGYSATTSGMGVGTSTAWAFFGVNPTAGIASRSFVVGSSSATLFEIENDGRVGIGTSTIGTGLMGQLNVESGSKNTSIFHTGSVNGFLESNIQNRSNGASASSDWVATADNGTPATHYVDFGINGSGGGQTPFPTANHGYLYSIDDPLNIGALGATAPYLTLNIGGGTSPIEFARLTPTGTGFGTTTPQWTMTLASSTKPQLTLTDGSLTSAPFNLRANLGYLTISTSSPTTFATTTPSIFELNSLTGSTTLQKLSVPSIGYVQDLRLGTPLRVAYGGSGASTLTGVLKGNGTSAFTVGVDGTDFTLTNAITCTNQVITAVTAAGVSTCSSINNSFWGAGAADLTVANGGTGLSTFGGTNTVLYTTAADTLASEAAFTYDQTANRITADFASSTSITTSGYAAFGGKVGVASTSPFSQLGVSSAAGVWPFTLGSSTGMQFGVSDYGTVTLTATQPATSTAIVLDWSKTGQQVEYRIGASATTITIINATTTQYWGTTKRVWVCNPSQTAGALTWAGVEWIGTAPTQTTTLDQCDVYFFDITRATSTSAYKVAGQAGTGFK